MPKADLAVLYEDNHVLVLNKPAGLPTMGVAADRESLLERARQYVKLRYQKPGNVYLGAMSRLDAPVSGVLLFARTSKAAARLTAQFAAHTVDKTYWAIVTGDVSPPAGRLVGFVKKDERHRKMHWVSAAQEGAQEARLSYRLQRATPLGTLLEVSLETGRKHQIRLQLAHEGWPVVGDRKYGSRALFPLGIALHSRRLVFTHPTRDERIEIVAPLPASWAKARLE
jgi:23S rRNA pseudouridine1911/1915/1917 synthase